MVFFYMMNFKWAKLILMSSNDNVFDVIKRFKLDFAGFDFTLYSKIFTEGSSTKPKY